MIIRIFILIFLTFTNNVYVSAQTDTYDEAELLSKFLSFTTFPKNQNPTEKDNKFIILVYKDRQLFEKLNNYFKTIKINQQTVIIEFETTIDKIKSPDVIYISKTDDAEVEKIVKFTENKPILTVTNTEKFVNQGIILYFYSDKNGISHKVNKKSLCHSGLKMKSELLNEKNIVNE